MSKYLKRYNEETGKWELVSAPDVSVIQQLPDGSEITDTNVIITNVNYAKESGETTLDEALGVISDDVSRLQRNVSWLAEHGGGGSGGSGSTSAYGIVIISPVLTDGSAYVSGKTFDIEFMITGGTDGDECTYSYTYDSEQPSDYTLVAVNQSVKIHIDNTQSPSKEHSIIIRAINPFGANIPTKSFRIYESTLTLEFDTATAGDDYKNGVYNIRQNSAYAYIPLILTNGLMNSRTVVTAKLNESIKSIEFTNETTNPQKVRISLWDILPKTSFIPGQYYVLTFNSSATLGTNTINSNEVQLRIMIVSPSEITVTMGVNGTSGEIVLAPLNSQIVYNFKVYVPALIPPVESTFYAAKVTNGEKSILVLGQFYDSGCCIEGKTYSDNPSVPVGTTVSSQFILNTQDFNVGDNIELNVCVWNITGDKSASAKTQITVIKESNEVFQQQSNTRSGQQGDTGGTVFVSWNKNNAVQTKEEWTSEINNYAFMDSWLLEHSGSTVISNMVVKNINSESKISIDEYGVPYLRLQNRAYAKVDLTPYEREVKMMTAENSENYGFTISFGIMQDLHNDTKHTLLLWGKNGSDGNLINGIRIDTDKVYWYINEKTSGGAINPRMLSCPIPSQVRTTVDFSYVKTNTGATARIYINGIANAATDLFELSPQEQYTFPNEIYFGANYTNNQVERFSDLNLYEFSVYTKSLNDLQIVVNSKNARFTTLEDYKTWKNKNFITAKASDEKIPESVFFDNGDYVTEFDAEKIQDIALRSNIPTLYINFNDSVGFTSEYFYEKHVTSDTGRTFAGTATYYDPSTNGTADNISILVSLQGTSTLGYRIKNLEFYINESFIREGVTYTKLFQPKKEWFPEKQFTLKADVVDSAHANNAVLGEFINNCGIFENNPAMLQFENNRPKDVDDTGREYGIDTDVTIKHTLEGFPILLFIKFSGSNSYTFLGIYSFNLGRYSYYNMGMKFLKSFSRRNGELKATCPKVINYYEEMDNLGSISGSDIYSFEMGNAGNTNIQDYPVWSQFTKSVVKSYGDFKYPQNVTEGIWDKLCELFSSIAKFKVTSYHSNSYTKYDGIKIYEIVNGQYVTDGREVGQDNNSNAAIVADDDGSGSLHVKNAMAYFMIANAFGMTDSLGKNLTIRTWDGGKTWWFCFYDMDTALGLANDGTESNPVTVAIDRIRMVSDPVTRVSTLYTDYHYEDSKFAAFSSKVWGVFRDDQFFYNTGRAVQYTYEYIWGELRKTGGSLSKPTNFTDIMEARVDSCGEMIYDYDYNTKYIQDTNEQDSGVTPAITFLHGTRVEYVKDWLRKHFYFLDGMFDVNRLGTGATFTFEDSPYNSDILTLAVNYSSSIPVLPYTVQVSTPTFIGLSVGNDAFKKFYIDTENTDTVIYIINGTSANSQISMRGSTLVTKFDGLQGGFLSIMGSNQNGIAKSLSVFDVNGSQAVSENPLNIDINGGIFGKNSSLEKINLSYTRGLSTLQEYGVYLEPFNKLIDVDVSNSEVTSLSLPKTALQRLSFHHSNIANFKLSNQNIISDVNFDGCDKLQTIDIDGCNAITDTKIENKINVGSIKITACKTLSSITITNCPALTSVEIGNNTGLKSITITNCENPSLDIRIYGSKLNNINLVGLSETTKAITLPDKNDMSQVTALTISNCYKISGIHYINSEPEEYRGEEVFDLSPLTSLNGENLVIRNIYSIKYIRVRNDDGENPVAPFEVYSDSFYGCRNLERVFGYISMYSSPFSGLGRFKLNEDSEFVPSTGIHFVLVSENPYYTNLKISSTNLSGWFNGTNCDIHDVYYVLQLCDENTVSLEGLFRNCANVITSTVEPIDEDTFSKLTGETVSVENINEIFFGCDISGPISPNFFPVNLMKNIPEFKNVLSGKYTFDSDETIFPVGNKIKYLGGFNPYINTYFKDTTMLRTLTELEVIENCFNGCSIDFASSDNHDARDLFKYNTKLISISNSFRELVDCVGSIKNIFGGEIEDANEEYYPRQLSSITNSFIFKSGAHDPVLCELYDEDDGNGILLPLGNSFLNKIAKSIVYITGEYPGDNSTYSQDSITLNMPCFSGPGLIKYIDNFDGYTPADCDGKLFPYKILSGCTVLKEYPNLFENLQNFKKDNNGNVIPITINLLEDENGVSIFKDCKSLENVSKMFYNLCSMSKSGNIYAKLTGGAFKNCNIKNADLIFSNKGNRKYEIIDSIPYGLFREEVEGEYQKQTGLTEQDAAAYGITDESGGTLTALTDYTPFEGTYTKINGTIKKMQGCLSNLKSLSLKPYKASIISWEDFVEDNPNYNPLKYLLDGLEYTLNPDYDPYKKLWNKYVFDGSDEFYRYLKPGDEKYIGIFSITDDYGNPIVNADEMPVQFTEGYIDVNNVENFLDTTDIGSDGDYGSVILPSVKTNVFGTRNYFCPPDIFRYCENINSVNVDRTFAESSDDFNNEFGDNYGLRGTIPEFIFEPISKIVNISSVFSSFKMLLPYKWRKVDGVVTIENGVTYPPMLFSGLTNVYSISSMFSGTRVWGNTIIPEGLFSDASVDLSDVSGMWSSAKWLDRDMAQLPQSTFNTCTKIRNISGMLSDSGNLSIYLINSGLFTVSNHPYLNNCETFLYRATGTYGTVPALWEWPSTQLTVYHYALKGVDDRNRIDNYDEAKFEKFVRDN